MKVILLCIIVFSLIVGPLMMMRPNPAQKKRERWRALGAAKGIRFSLRQLPQQSTEQQKPEPLSVYFYAPADAQTSHDWMLIRATYQHELHLLGWWAWQNEHKVMPSELQLLKVALVNAPEGVRGVSSGSQGICIYWDERGGDDACEWVFALLDSLRDAQLSQ